MEISLGQFCRRVPTHDSFFRFKISLFLMGSFPHSFPYQKIFWKIRTPSIPRCFPNQHRKHSKLHRQQSMIDRPSFSLYRNLPRFMTPFLSAVGKTKPLNGIALFSTSFLSLCRRQNQADCSHLDESKTQSQRQDMNYLHSDKAIR
jgi:hypothetical protein